MIPSLEDIEVERIHSRDADKKVKKKDIEIDMNPMVDLAFLLLTFFMLATTFSKPQAMELVIPAKPKPDAVEQEMAVKESRTVSLVLFEDHATWYRGITDPETKDVSYDKLEPLFRSINENTKDVVVLIKPREESAYRNLVAALDALNYAGVQRYAMSPLSEFDEQITSEIE